MSLCDTGLELWNNKLVQTGGKHWTNSYKMISRMLKRNVERAKWSEDWEAMPELLKKYLCCFLGISSLEMLLKTQLLWHDLVFLVLHIWQFIKDSHDKSAFGDNHCGVLIKTVNQTKRCRAVAICVDSEGFWIGLKSAKVLPVAPRLYSKDQQWK